jgi:hypothetical protein
MEPSQRSLPLDGNMISALRHAPVFRRIRRSRLVLEWVRPVYARRQLREWWAKGRPAPPPHDIKLLAILYLADLVRAKMLVETGSYLGDTVRALRGRFELIASIEIAPALAEPLQREFAGDKSVRIILGDSGKMLSNLLIGTRKQAVFWLDAHYSGGPTLGEGYVPIFAELDTIAQLAHPQHAVLIDDVRDFTGKDSYPTAGRIVEHLRKAGYRVAVANNMIHALPAGQGCQ